MSVLVESPDALKFRGERQDLEEMIGNLLDNACKWSAGEVRVKADLIRDADATGRHWFTVTVDDDGPACQPTSARKQ